MANILPDRARFAIYLGYAVVGLILGSIVTGYASADFGQPVWLIVANAVYVYLGGAFGFTAATHTSDGGRHRDDDELPVG